MKKKKKKMIISIIADLTIGKGPFKATYKSDVKYYKSIDEEITNIAGPQLVVPIMNGLFLKRIIVQKYLLILILKLKINF